MNKRNEKLELLIKSSMNKRRPLITYMPIHPHIFPAGWRNYFKKIYSMIVRDEQIKYAWNSVDKIRWNGYSKPNWDGKKYAVVISHDVDSDWIFKNKNYELFANIEEEHGFHSSWNVVTNKYHLNLRILDILRDRGHEIAFHDYNHDLKTPFLSEKKMLERFEKSKCFIERYDVRGMRTPACFKTDRLFKIAKQFFSYDSSFQDYNIRTGNGCFTVFPFFLDEMLVIPITIPEDTQFIENQSSDEILTIMLEKIEYIKSMGGLVSISIHPEPTLGANEKWLNIFEKLIKHISKDNCWKTLHEDIDKWWRLYFSESDLGINRSV